jgi:hypothetical protein
MTVYSGKSVRDVLMDYGLIGKPYQQTVWSHVMRDGNILVLDRTKKDDKLRGTSTVIPSGRLDPDERYLNGCQRETTEETHVESRPGDLDKFRNLYDKTIVRRRKNITVAIQPNGRMWAFYTDSEKRYTGWLFDLIGLTEPSEPEEEESTNPRYVNFEQIMDEGYEGFTPASRAWFEVIEKDWGREITRPGDVFLESVRMIPHLKVINQYDMKK